jgi:hypothetical protein
MLPASLRYLLLLAAICACFTLGCTNTSTPTSPSAPSAQAGHDHDGHVHGEGDEHEDGDAEHKDGDEEHEDDAVDHATDQSGLEGADAAILAKLSPEVREAVLKQKRCPVSDEPLASMGLPALVTIKGQDVYLCCEGCRKDLEADPDTYLAKLAK